MFPQKDVCFTANSNSTDSSDTSDNDLAPFLNIMNGCYARDTGNKIKETFDSGMKDDKRCSGGIPDGYNHVEGDKQALAVDPSAAKAVRRIYVPDNEGKSPGGIPDILSEGKYRLPVTKSTTGSGTTGRPVPIHTAGGLSAVRKIPDRQSISAIRCPTSRWERISSSTNGDRPGRTDITCFQTPTN